jgi:hypothetical protein
MTGFTIQELRLSPMAERAARLVLAQHPAAVFTSGRRDLMDQARAMAQNAVSFGASWLNDTYKNKRIVHHLMTFMEENPEHCRDAKVLGHHFYEQLQEHFAGEYAKFPHLRGDAFDIRYPRLKNGLYDRPSGDQIMATIRALPEHGIPLEWVTDQEGKLVVIHAQFKAGSVEV